MYVKKQNIFQETHLRTGIFSSGQENVCCLPTRAVKPVEDVTSGMKHSGSRNCFRERVVSPGRSLGQDLCSQFWFAENSVLCPGKRYGAGGGSVACMTRSGST